MNNRYCCNGTVLAVVNACKSIPYCCVGTDICEGCNDGFSKNALTGSCTDINECETIYGVCSAQTCLNSNASFTCNCSDGYVDRNKMCLLRTEEEPLLLFTTRSNIRTLKLDNIINSSKSDFESTAVDMKTLYTNLASTIAIDYNINDNYIIWSDVSNRQIYIGTLDNRKTNSVGLGSEKQILLSDDIYTPDGLAIDWVHNLIYWTDTGIDTINVADIRKPENRVILISLTLDEPRAILVNVEESFIVWSDWGINAKIEKADQDGSNRVMLVNEDILWPNGIAIDHHLKRIYWVDAKLSSLSSINYNGSDRRLIIKSKEVFKHPFNMDIFGDDVYISDWIYNAILKVNKFGINGEHKELIAEIKSMFRFSSIHVSSSSTVMDLKIIHSTQKPISTNRCVNHTCSYLCLPSAYDTHRCVCPSSKYVKTIGDCSEYIDNEKQFTSTTPLVSKQTSFENTKTISIKLNSTTKSLFAYSTNSPNILQSEKIENNNTDEENIQEITEIISELQSDSQQSSPNEDNNTKQYSSNAIWIFIITLITLDAMIIIVVFTVFCRKDRKNKSSKRHFSRKIASNAIYRKSDDDKLLLVSEERNCSFNEQNTTE